MFLTAYSLLALINSGVEYSAGNLTKDALLFALLGRLFLYAIAIALLVMINKSPNALHNFVVYYTIYSFLFLSFIVFADNRVLNAMTGSSASASYNSCIVFTVYILITRELLFCNFKVMAFCLFYFTTIYLIVFLATGATATSTIICEILIVGVTIAVFVKTSYKVEEASKIVFQRFHR